MGRTVSFDYFYGGQSDTFSYYRIPLLRSWVYAFLDYSNRLLQLPPSPTGSGVLPPWRPATACGRRRGLRLLYVGCGKKILRKKGELFPCLFDEAHTVCHNI